MTTKHTYVCFVRKIDGKIEKKISQVNVNKCFWKRGPQNNCSRNDRKYTLEVSIDPPLSYQIRIYVIEQVKLSLIFVCFFACSVLFLPRWLLFTVNWERHWRLGDHLDWLLVKVGLHGCLQLRIF